MGKNGGFHESGERKCMGQSFFLDDSLLCHSPFGDRDPLLFGNLGILGLLRFDPGVSFVPPIIYEENGLQGYAQGI